MAILSEQDWIFWNENGYVEPIVFTDLGRKLLGIQSHSATPVMSS